MSDLTIPGVKSDIDTEKIIEALLGPERVKIEQKENEIDQLKNEKNIWQDLSLRLTRLQDSSKSLYSYDNPFNDRIVVSNDETVLIATATRNSIEETKEFIIKQMAKADRFMTDSLSKDFIVEAGTYRFVLGDEVIEFTFNGGSLKEFADRINEKAGDLLKASVVNDTTETQVLIIESKITGSENKLYFEEAALDFALKAGILEEVKTQELDIPLSNITSWEKPLNPNLYQLEDGRLTLFPQSELKIPVTPQLELNTNIVLEIDYDVKIIQEEEYVPQDIPPGPDTSIPGGAQFGDIIVENEWPDLKLPSWELPEPPERIDDLQVFYFGSEGEIIPLPKIDSSGGSKTLTINIGQLTNSLEALYLRNNNTYREITITDIRIYDPSVRGDYTFKHALSEAQDAIIFMDGIEITRSTNEIDDLIPGVNLTILSEKEEPVKLEIKKDIDKILNTVIEFVGFYNQLLTQLDILLRNDPSVIDDAAYLSYEEQEEAEKILGLMQGDITLSQLKSSLRTIMSNSYKTQGEYELSLLAQLGISTDVSELGGGGLDKTKLRGYLEMDEEVFKEALNRNPEWVKQLFGWDTDGDFVPDSGVAFALNEYIKPFLSLGGILPNKVDMIDSTIAEKNDDIDDLNQRLVEYEEQLRRDYGMLEGMLEQLEQSQKSLENFQNNNR